MLPIAIAALLALSATAEAATTKYDYGGRESYQHENRGSYEPSYEHKSYDHGHEAYKTRYYFEQDHEPSYESHYAGQDYREPHHDRYDEGYGGDAYSEESSYTDEPSTKSRPTYRQSHAYRRKRSVQDEAGARDGQLFGLKKKLKIAELNAMSNIFGRRPREQTTEKPDMEETTPKPEVDPEQTPDPMPSERRKRSVRYAQSRPTYKESHEPRSYRNKRSVSYGYGGDSHGKSYSTYSSYKPVSYGYGGDSYGKSYRHKRQAEDESTVAVNEEVRPGCFSSPPEDCGTDCVASFIDGCYQCCCHENPVNATTCALPADDGDGARCRGNFERWAFNGATGACEPFAYGGCGGNGNRFMCKEMCERHCVHCVRCREGQQLNSGCCRQLRVLSVVDKRAKVEYPERFQLYRWAPAMIDGRDHWVSDDRRFAIWRNRGKWIIGPFERIGSGGEPEAEIGWGIIRTDEDDECPENIGFKWKYWVSGVLISAERSLIVQCEIP